MLTMTVRMADFRFGVAFRHRSIARALAPYRARGAREFRVQATDEGIRSIAARSADFEPSPREAESLALFEAICARLPARGALMLHAACLAVDGGAYLFLAPSGTGKTTHMLNWMRLLEPGRAQVVNGDKPFLRLAEDGFFAYGNPWAGKEGLHTPMRARLSSLCFLERGASEHIARLTPREALPRLIRQVYLPRTRPRVDKTLLLLDRLARTVPAYLLHCTASPDAARLAIETMLPADASTEREPPSPDRSAAPLRGVP